MSSTTSPRLVFGTYRLPDDASVVFPVLSAARDTGFTMIDTAALYRNESIVRDFALDPAARMEWGTKVHKIMFPGALRYKMESMVRKNKGRPMARLLLHRALPPHMWTELQEAHRDGLVGDIGVCNVSLKQLQTLCGNAATAGTQRPTVVQVECHPFLPDVDAVVALGQYCRRQGIHVEMHSILVGGGDRLADIAKRVGLCIDDAVVELVRWARWAIPDASLCLTSRRRDHMRQLEAAFHSEELPRLEIATAFSTIERFRLYPITDSVAPISPITDDKDTMVSPEYARQLAACIVSDRSLLDRDPPVDASQYSGFAFSMVRAKGMHANLFERVAVIIFGCDDVQADLDALPTLDAAVVNQWKQHPGVQSAVAKLTTLLKRIRVTSRPNSSHLPSAPNGKPLSCAVRPRQVVSLAKDDPIPDAILHPTAMPVDVTDRALLQPFFDYVASLRFEPTCHVEFQMGAMLTNHLDMCKQVVGPAHMDSLCLAVHSSALRAIFTQRRPPVRHFLLGNNVAFDKIASLTGAGARQANESTRVAGLDQLTRLMGNDCYGIETWYLAGNCIDGHVMGKIADALASIKVCKQLWLKRNPLGADGGAAIGRLLASNRAIEMLDLANTGLLDAGMQALAESEASHLQSSPTTTKSPLAHVHMTANGITASGAQHLAAFLRMHRHALETVLLDINRLGDDGVAVVLKALESSTTLRRLGVGSNRLTDAGLRTVAAFAARHPTLATLNVGMHLATGDLGERYNAFTNVKPLVALVETHPGLEVLKVERTGLSLPDVRRIIDAAQARKERDGHKVSVYGLQLQELPGKSAQSDWMLLAHDDAALRELKHPPMVDHIYSIYRNNM